MRKKIIFIFKDLAVLLFFLMFVYVALVKIFGESIFPVKYVGVIFFSSVLFLILTFIPPRLNKEYFNAWIFFISIFSIFIVFFIGFLDKAFNLFVLSKNLKIILSILWGVGFVGFFGSLFSGESTNREEIKLNVINSFNEVVKKMNLELKDLSTDEKVILEAEGKHRFGYLELLVEFTFKRRFKKFLGIDKSAISIRTLKEIKSLYKIEVFRGEIRTENLSEAQELKIIDFIKERQLDYFDFTLNTISNTRIIINVYTQIEETELWLDFIRLIEILLE
jgi:hypothetical protein